MFSPYFSLKVTPAEAFSAIISISKKVSKRAVVRNTVKRRIRPILAQAKKSLKPATYLIIVKPGAEALKGEALKSELTNLLAR